MADPNPSPSPSPDPSPNPNPSPSPNPNPSPNPQPSPNSHPWHVNLINSDGTINRSNFDNLPEPIKPYRAQFEKYAKVDDMFLGMANLATLAGKKGLHPLPDGASDDIKKEFNTTLRSVLKIPEKIKGAQDYGIAKPDNLPDEMWDGEYVDSMVKLMHENNIPPEAARKLVEADAARAAQMHVEHQAKIQEAKEGARKAIAEAFGADYSRKILLAERGARTLGLDPQNPKYGNDPEFVIAMSKLATMLGEHNLVSGDATGPGGGGSDKDRAEDIINNPSNPLHGAYHNRNAPNHQSAVAQVQAFFRRHHDRGGV